MRAVLELELRPGCYSNKYERGPSGPWTAERVGETENHVWVPKVFCMLTVRAGNSGCTGSHDVSRRVSGIALWREK